jgi:NAD(P)H-dependent flavin oxidoreductase YrpB (nitropropane dioxygenase family)
MDWNNRVTQLLGSEYPIVQGAYQGFGNSTIAAPVSEAGGFGIITAHAFRTPERLREDIRKAKAMTDKPFGVNFSVGFVPRIDEMLEIVIEEEIPVVETSVFRADECGQRLRNAGVKWIHKAASMDHALSAVRRGADAVIIVGLEGIGFKHTSQLPTLIAVAWAARQTTVPIIAAGGIGDARSFAAALCLGAEGICMGTAFLATKECPVSDSHKRALVEASPRDDSYRRMALAPPNPEDYARVMQEKESLSMDRWLKRLEKVTLGQSPEEPMKTKSMAKGSLAVAFIDRIVTVKELINDIVRGAEEILGGQLPRRLS